MSAERPGLQRDKDFGANPGALEMVSYVPPGLAAGAPLVVALHGCTQNAGGFDAGCGWSTMADRLGFAVLLPEQVRANNSNLCFNWFEPNDVARDVGEAASIHQMIEAMVSRHRLDRGRVFVTGLSAGGAMASVMLAAYPDVFAGGAIVAGLPYGVATSVQEALQLMHRGTALPPRALGDLIRRASGHRGPWPRVAIWQGASDHTVVPANADVLAAQWLDVHGLALDAGVAAPLPGGRISRTVWGRTSEPSIELTVIDGLGHAVPLGSAPDPVGIPGRYFVEAGVSATLGSLAFWGLMAAEQALPQPERPRSDPPRAGLGRLDPGEVIRRALASAGLMSR